MDLQEVTAAVEAMFKDQWVIDKRMVSMKYFSSNLNKYRSSTGQQAEGQRPMDDGAIEVHSLPQPGEEPFDCPWLRTGQRRIDEDIPRKNRERALSEFSSELVRRALDWIAARDFQQGWTLTLIGEPGNGKSTFAATMLQHWRDHVTPEMLDVPRPLDLPDIRSGFVTFETFKDNASVERTNESTGWVDPPEINWEYIDRLTQIKFLVLDDLCSKELQKIEYDALHRLLRARYDAGRMTVITTNKTIPELSRLLGENVADRFREGVVLKFVDCSQRGEGKTLPQGVKHIADGIRYMPNPEVDPDKAYIPYVEPENEERDTTSVVAQAESAATSQAVDHADETFGEDDYEYDSVAVEAAIASLGCGVATQTEAATAICTTPTRPMSRWGEHYDEDYEEELNQ